MQKTSDGPVIYDSSKCMGCRYCMMACPFGVPRYDWDQAAPKVRKCTMCYAAMRDGKRTEPACTEACPTGATIFKSRDVLLVEAHRRIAENPSKYKNIVLGETEVGGTSVLYLSDISLDFLGFKPELGTEPLPERTWSVLSKIPPAAVGLTGALACVWWIINRRNKLAQEAAGGSARNPGPRTARLPHEINATSHLQGEPGGPPPANVAPPIKPPDENDVKK
jgi:formate dehydrogenase iron-sulfur subunit